MKQTPLKRNAMKRSQPRRDWTDARAKVEYEAACRFAHLGGCKGLLEAAHVIGREVDSKTLLGAPRPSEPWCVAPARVFPACTRHHRLYDAHELDALPVLKLHEQVQAVEDAGGLELARIRTAPLAYRKQDPGPLRAA